MTAVRCCRLTDALRAVLVCCLCAFWCAPAARAQSSVYSWTDEKGTLHFSNAGPPAESAENVTRRIMRPHVPRPVPASSDEIPFVFVGADSSRRFVPVVLEGGRRQKEILMLVDTGAQMTLIDEDLADELDVEHVRDAQIVGVSGAVPGWLGRLRSLRLGGEEIQGPHVMVGPRQGMHLLGMDVLGALNLSIGPEALEKAR